LAPGCLLVTKTTMRETPGARGLNGHDAIEAVGVVAPDGVKKGIDRVSVGELAVKSLDWLREVGRREPRGDGTRLPDGTGPRAEGFCGAGAAA